MRLTLVLLVAAGCAAVPARGRKIPASGWLIASPSGDLEVKVELSDLGGTAGYPAGHRLYYSARLGDSQVVFPSPLGITRADQQFVEGLNFLDESGGAIKEVYDLPHGKRSHYENEGVERVLAFENPQRARVELILRVFNDGFAFRYRFPESNLGAFTVTAEATGFRVPGDGRGYMAPHDRRRNHRPDYESLWQEVAVGTASEFEGGWVVPALFRSRGGWLLVTEAGLDGTYCATHLAQRADHGVYRIAFPHPSEVSGKFDARPSSSLPWATPWRVVMVGERLSTIVESTLVTDLAAPSVVADTSWIRPGRATWSWWSEGSSPRAYPRLLPFVDLAAEMGWEYSLVDSGWPAMEGGTWQQLAEYARPRQVGVLLWYHSGVPHPNYRNRDTMWIAAKRREEMARVAAAGVKGMKIDFFDSDKQEVIRNYLGILADAAAARLLVNFHGSTMPRGWQRTYPNLMSMEGVRGAEGYGSDTVYADAAPAHHTMLVFTRNVVGPMDYTPVIFTNKKLPHRTTHAHEVALSVVFESGIQHFADRVEGYRSLPEEARAFLKMVPAAWDETRLLDGEPGKLAVLARRKGATWYVGGINGEATEKQVSISGDFVTPVEGNRDILLIADGDSDSTFLTAHRVQGGPPTQVVRLRPYGGFALRIASAAP
jgi:hypothetical protein